MSADGTGSVFETGAVQTHEATTAQGDVVDTAISERNLGLLRFVLGVSSHSPEDARRLCDELLPELCGHASPLEPAVRVLRERLTNEFRFGVGARRVDVKRGIGNVAIVLREHSHGVVALSGKLLMQQLHANRHK